MLGLFVTLVCCYYYCYPRMRYRAAFGLFFLATAGFQLPPIDWMVWAPLGITKCYDWIIVFLAFVLAVHPSTFFRRAVWKRFRYLNAFFLFLVVLIIYSIVVQKVEPAVAIRVFRNYLFIIVVYVFCELSRPELDRIFRLIVYLTVLASVIYCLQLVVGTSLLNNLLDDYSTIDLQINNGLARYYNIPIIGTPVFFLLLCDRTIVRPSWKWPLLIPVLGAIILSQHRNLLLSIIACCFVFYIVQKKIGIARIALLAGCSMLILAGVNSITDNRFTEGFSDLNTIVSSGVSRNTILMADVNLISTSQFRFYHFVERLSYILESPVRSVFGAGLLSEDSHVVRHLHFNIGLPNAISDVTQVDTGDIVWSLLVLHFGLAGTALFIAMYIDLLVRFFRNRSDPRTMAGFIFLTSLFFTSFYGMGLVIPPVTVVTMLFAACLTSIPETASTTQYPQNGKQ